MVELGRIIRLGTFLTVLIVHTATAVGGDDGDCDDDDYYVDSELCDSYYEISPRIDMSSCV
ncbi:unnamed protein product [Cyberlindnera jadinii]|uniref:Uncharacterized protein n=1 Tax=Cyberlindnera jadinii (strain ATCC 18201 / CBS 1600 / BCRC 20928 / JCM 3617 / NBRC 0987 / NRRL Y-1542) TaxID=983966 RepID=A0A0H5C0A7_CYBJN|nr:hypothetical protein CYBJADRAFT_165723 [Cyberlindnera jadinii NRRL Y-1542]ODV76441.1 hypothetical protein CYBJADRAFT_165723 [Cyberlindnera jadinii NRRL Y-1542]CEP21071.1 unnamed protein product [Cyberlindnera jadinii]